MTNRRRFIQTLAALPPAYALRNAWAANAPADPSRLALIIGNSSYRDAPLVNPANDAKAVSGLFTQAGFTVDSRLNATRGDMMAAIEKFGAAVKKSETRLVVFYYAGLVVFYYAGHGAQLDWRNYLLPVDAVVERQEHMKERCVDLSLLLGQFSAAKDKTFVVILDACRNNPFGTSYRPDQKGLSQFDAPVGSLLAYATSPGNVASDGEGANGLYTENLVRELGKRGTRIEDALKRVRLNVRLASKGEQIPWETTSLEGDVFIFNEGQKKLSEAELEKLVEADMTEWGRIKSSKKVDDWVTYLQTFPNGRFAEIAQMRLTRLLADVEKQRAEREQQDTTKVNQLAAEKRQQEEQKRLEDQKRLEQERAEQEKIRLAAAQRLAAERKQLEEQQAQEQRRREEEQKAIDAKRRQEQERLDKERQRIAEAERAAAERKKEEEQRQLAAQERAERERMRLAEAGRLAAERKRLEEQQATESRRREEEQKTAEAKRRLEQERLDRERQRIVEAERQAAEHTKQEGQRLAAEEQRRKEQEKAAAAARPAASQGAVAVSAPATAATPGTFMINIGAGLPVPQLMAPSDNPFSAGRYPLGRIFTVGDEATARVSDILTGVEERVLATRVTRVDYDEDRIEYNNGMFVTDLMGNPIKQGPVEFDNPLQLVSAEFQIGKKWTATYRRTEKGSTSNGYFDLEIVKRETITVPAGTFDTFRTEGIGWDNYGNKLETRFWQVPGLNVGVKSENMFRRKSGQFFNTQRRELVSLRQQTIDTKCALPTGGLKRTLTIKSNCTA
ncbi:MAG: caspase family protein [Sulfuritalea sp.]|nr:caspase family protein [Sulfuritalea sp.]